jgi:hypothetical protein
VGLSSENGNHRVLRSLAVFVDNKITQAGSKLQPENIAANICYTADVFH